MNQIEPKTDAPQTDVYEKKKLFFLSIQDSAFISLIYFHSCKALSQYLFILRLPIYFFFFIGTYSARLFKYEHKNIPPLASLSLLFVYCLPHQNSIKSNNTDLLISQPHNRKKKAEKFPSKKK